MPVASSGYGHRVRVSLPFDQAVQKVTAALSAEGFGVVTELDMAATLAQKIGVEFRPYVILGACIPQLAHHALLADLDAGVLLPCNVCVWQEEENRCVVSAVDPHALLGVVGGAGLEEVAADAKARLLRALETAGA